MNVFHHVALQSLKRSPARTLVTIVGIALAAALMTVVAAFGTSLLHFLVISAENKYGDWHVSFDAVDTAFVQAQAQDPQVAHTAVLENLGYATLEGVQSPEKPYLFLAGLPAASWDTLPIRLLSGRLPENDGEVLVPSHLAVKGGVSLSVGDTLTLSVGSRQAGGTSLNQADPYRPGEETLVSTTEKTYTVVGTCERPTLEPHDAPGYTLLTTAAPQGKLPPSVCSSPCITPARRRTTPPTPGTAARLCTMSPCCAFWGHRRALYFKPSWSLSAAACWPLSWWGRFS